MSRRKDFDPRALMERALEVMRASRAEPRDDGKASPRVGALLWFPDGKIQTACRGELRDGDHAEFTLLERKNRDTALDQAVLFATLEPCAPGSRNHPKLSCAKRIVLARIRRVWVGIEDPDPLVDRKGIRYLQDHGVDVQMFDRDLQEEIREANRAFLEQALERAAAASEEPEEPVVLSILERSLPAAELRDLDLGALEKFRSASRITDAVDSPEFHRQLLALGLVEVSDGGLRPSGFGILLFGGNPRAHLPQAGLLGRIEREDGEVETRDFDGPAIEIPDQAIQWIKDKLPNPILRDQAKRRERFAPYFEVVREGIVNALIHRDYGIEGAKCQLRASPERTEIMSPGPPVPPITLPQLQSFEAPMLSRNPALHFVFAQLKLAEEKGLGLLSMRSLAQDAGLPLPSYSLHEPYVVLGLARRASAAASTQARREILASLNPGERAGWEWLATREVVTTSEYEEALEVSKRTARHHLGHFQELGLVRKVGAGRATRYEVIQR